LPPDAKGKAIFGTVAVKVEIDKMGKPRMLDRVTVEVETTITVNFEPR
jgi:hypothetical protein